MASLEFGTGWSVEHEDTLTSPSTYANSHVLTGPNTTVTITFDPTTSIFISLNILTRFPNPYKKV